MVNIKLHYELAIGYQFKMDQNGKKLFKKFKIKMSKSQKSLRVKESVFPIALNSKCKLNLHRYLPYNSFIVSNDASIVRH